MGTVATKSQPVSNGMEPTELKELNQRNTQAVEQALKDMNERIYDAQKQINGLNDTLAGIIERLIVIEQFVAIQKVKFIGRGPTE